MIKAIWNFLFMSCRHKYENIDIIENKRIYKYQASHTISYTYVQQCNKCGKLNQKTIKSL